VVVLQDRPPYPLSGRLRPSWARPLITGRSPSWRSPSNFNPHPPWPADALTCFWSLPHSMAGNYHPIRASVRDKSLPAGKGQMDRGTVPLGSMQRTRNCSSTRLRPKSSAHLPLFWSPKVLQQAWCPNWIAAILSLTPRDQSCKYRGGIPSPTAPPRLPPKTALRRRDPLPGKWSREA